MPNYNQETGIPFGVIYMNSLNSDIAHELWVSGEDISYRNACEEIESEVRAEYEEIAELQGEEIAEYEDAIEQEIENRTMNIEIDEPVIEGEREGVKYMINWLGGAPLLWVFESPVIALANPCSLCIPGAGNLDSLNEQGMECYGVPADWLRSEV